MIFTPKLMLLTAIFTCSLMFVGDYIYNLAIIPEHLRSYATTLASLLLIYAFYYFLEKNAHRL